MLLAYEVTRDLPLQEVSVETPVCRTKAPQLSGKKLALVSIMRAGNGLLDGILELIPAARVGFVGLYRCHYPAKGSGSQGYSFTLFIGGT